MFSVVCLTQHSRAVKLFFLFVLSSLLVTTACQKSSVSDVATAKTNSTAANAEPAPSAPTASPSASAPVLGPPGAQVAVGVAPDFKQGQPSPAASSIPGVNTSPGASPTVRHIQNGKMIIVEGKNGPPDLGMPPPTPTPTPAPTPTVEMVNGKIKQQWQAPAEFVNMKSPLKVTPDITKKGQYLYKNRCEICHGSEGKGNGPYNDPKWKQATNLASKAVQANTDGELFYKVSTSRDRHPASKVLYTEEERWMVVAFLRTLK